MLLRDAQVLPIWEGTTDVLALDALRVVQRDGLEAVRRELERCLGIAGPGEPSAVAASALASCERWLERASGEGREALEAGARRFGLTLGRGLELALTAAHAGRSRDRSPAESARRLAASPIDRVRPSTAPAGAL